MIAPTIAPMKPAPSPALYPPNVPDDVYEEARRHFSEKELVDLTAAVIAIDAWNRVAIAFRPTPLLKSVKLAA